MTTVQQERPTLSLVGPRTKKETGMPTSGLFLVVGHPKAGKTTFAASFPDSYVLELEKHGAARIGVGARIHEIEDDYDAEGRVSYAALDKFGDVLELVINDPDIKTIVIDSVDELASWVEKSVAKEAGVEYIGKPKPGVDSRSLWGDFRQRIEGMTQYLKDSGKLVIMIAHCRPPEKDNEGRVITPAGINVAGKGGQYIAAQAEMIGFVGVRTIAGKAQHYITFKAPSDLAIWRSRVDELHDREIILDKADPYGSFVAVFDQEKPEPVKPSLKPQPAATKANGTRRK